MGVHRDRCVSGSGVERDGDAVAEPQRARPSRQAARLRAVAWRTIVGDGSTADHPMAGAIGDCRSQSM
jgi:hypothetical protein